MGHSQGGITATALDTDDACRPQMCRGEDAPPTTEPASAVPVLGAAAVRRRSSLRESFQIRQGALGGIRTPNLLIRSDRQDVSGRLLVARGA